MEINPRTQAQMLLAAFTLGLGTGVLRQLLLALRTVLGAHLPSERMRKHYERPLPLLKRSIGFSPRRGKVVWHFLVAFFGDVLFCLITAFSLLLLFYHYNFGAFRISAILLFVLGFAFFQVATARVVSRGNELLAWGISAGLLYVRALVCWPLRALTRLGMRFLWRPIRKGAQALYSKRLARVSRRLCRAQLALASRGLILEERKMSDVEKKNHTDAVDHQDSDRAAVLHGACRRLWPLARVDRAGKAKRGAGKTKRGN